MFFKVCGMCGEEHELNVTPDQVERYNAGEHAQTAFRYLSAGDRELIISGVCGSCFDEMFR